MEWLITNNLLGYLFQLHLIVLFAIVLVIGFITYVNKAIE